MRYLILVAPMLAVAVAASPVRAQRFAVAGIDDDSSVVGFLRELQAAVRRDDRDAVAALIRYPIAVHDSAGTTAVQDRHEFIAQYSSIINPNVRRAVLLQSPDSLFANWQGVMIGRGHIWLNLICGVDPPHACTRLAITTINRDAPPDP